MHGVFIFSLMCCIKTPQFRQLLSAIGFIPDWTFSNRLNRKPNSQAGHHGISCQTSAPSQLRSQLGEGSKVKAIYYGDGKWYEGTIQAETGKGNYVVLFTGYEEDPPQVSQIEDLYSSFL